MEKTKVIEALANLGYSERDAKKCINDEREKRRKVQNQEKRRNAWKKREKERLLHNLF